MASIETKKNIHAIPRILLVVRAQNKNSANNQRFTEKRQESIFARMGIRHALPVAALLFALVLSGPVRATEDAGISTDPDSTPVSTGTPISELIVQGLAYLDTPYRFGGNSRDTGIDCSALVQQVFQRALGLDLPRTTTELAKIGDDLKRAQLKAGDLVFFNTRRRAYSHVGIYLGGDRFIHAPSSGGKVRIESLNTHYWNKRFNGGRRVVSHATSPAATSTLQ
ncbi:MAG TPA: NlpC/P60 family protein [Denitromonas sp.]|uniref:C40 family peptidase n=1 Tax=Denitromonas sp. TaxID=2734609 RepID=UPI002BC3D25E|nr:NlpC/P60 family protein [Denitromonas sp.]HQV13394.1 NlpC/P60 family protein [Denitromonas sp.]